MKALALLKHNIDTLLKQRGHSRRDLAGWVRQSNNKRLIDPWISHIFRNPEQDIPAKYLDRIADFLGVDVHTLFQPGLTSETDRRKGERRSGRDRRVTHLRNQARAVLAPASAHITEEDIADLIRLRTLSADSRAVVRKQIATLDRSEREAVGQTQAARDAGKAGGTAGASAVRGRRRPPEGTERQG